MIQSAARGFLVRHKMVLDIPDHIKWAVHAIEAQQHLEDAPEIPDHMQFAVRHVKKMREADAAVAEQAHTDATELADRIAAISEKGQ